MSSVSTTTNVWTSYVNYSYTCSVCGQTIWTTLGSHRCPGPKSNVTVVTPDLNYFWAAIEALRAEVAELKATKKDKKQAKP